MVAAVHTVEGKDGRKDWVDRMEDSLHSTVHGVGNLRLPEHSKKAPEASAVLS